MTANKVEIIGRCKLILANSLDILPTLPLRAAVISDPPYGMRWNTDISRFTGGNNKLVRQSGRNDKKIIHNDNVEFDPSPWLKFNEVILWGSNHYGRRLPVGSSLVWIKKNEPAFGSFLSDAELGWQNKGHGVYCYKDLSMNAETRRRKHPTQKPVSLMRWCIRRTKSELIIDPYMGSGSTGVAAIDEGCSFIGVEIDPEHYRVACERIRTANMDEAK